MKPNADEILTKIMNPEPPEHIEDFVVGSAVLNLIKVEDGYVVNQYGIGPLIEAIEPLVPTGEYQLHVSGRRTGSLSIHDGRYWLFHETEGVFPTGEETIEAVMVFLARSMILGTTLVKAA